MRNAFRLFAKWTSDAVGSPWAFMLAVFIIVMWALSGSFYHYSDTWQLIINTGTTIVTFLMVFLIQYAQNRDAKAIHLKLDELIKAVGGARNSMIDLDALSDEELRDIEKRYKSLSHVAHEKHSARAESGSTGNKAKEKPSDPKAHK